jgi:hypothetical protein
VNVFLFERTVDLEIKKAHAELKVLLLQKGCRILAEGPTLVSAKQGSLWGISPRTAEKIVTCRFVPLSSGTRITCSSSLASDWKNLTIIGTALAVVVVSMCWWIVTDLNALMTTQQPSYWSWLVTVNGYIDFQTAQMLAGLMLMLAVFLVIMIAIEMVISVYVHFRINVFAAETLSELR